MGEGVLDALGQIFKMVIYNFKELKKYIRIINNKSSVNIFFFMKICEPSYKSTKLIK